MYITIPQVSNYLNGLYRPLNQKLEALRANSEDRHIPIILRDAEELILNYIRVKKPKRILELGTAVGYSALCFATVAPYCHITTLELSETSYYEAQENIARFSCEEQIAVVLGDAKDTLKTLNAQYKNGEIEPFDMVFIDASKGHYQAFWDQVMGLITPDAIIISDNVLYKAITASDEFLASKRNGTIMRRMRAFLTHITNLEDVSTCVLPVGDGLAISQFDRHVSKDKEEV